ncbi:stachyose synthase [Phtheirospermum japonicum]|uniref:galactinol--sucrose galactosyltransferase n=1 Tax=Phtheirospermum japonicum TaxID=374723 RepID=A0A830D867_9LAMI|nr:stachyose synthase [Phtheirospermum japonicum]
MAPPNLILEKLTSCFQKEKNPPSRFFLSPNRQITVDGITLLSDVPQNITLSAFNSVPHPSNNTISPPPKNTLKSVNSNSENGAFLGLSIKDPLDRILNPIGKLNDRKFLSIFRFKTWWSTMWVGSNGSDLQMETQIILFQVQELNSYVVILPLIEKNFRSAIHPGPKGEITLCVESGSTKVAHNTFNSCAYFHIGENPYDLMRDALASVRVHLGTFRLLEEKNPPRIIDRFGWCTWDAFYLTVEPVGVWHGVKSLSENGVPPKFLIIDDGWQSINMDHEDPFRDSRDLTGLGSQMLCRLYRFKENEKFAKYRAEEEGKKRGGLKALISDLKNEFPGVEDVYVWHALCGAWGGVRPGTTRLTSRITKAKMAKGLEKTMYDLAVDMVEKGGIGLVDPNEAEDFYEAMHSYLADAGVTGVKVDVIHTLEYVCEDHGGRVELAKAYYDGLTKSLRKNFNGTGLIASMEQCNDFFFLGTNQISMARVGDDFWFEDPNGDPMGVYWLQGVHMVHCSYNSLWQGQFIQPDWDMFQSDHLCAEFHAGSRAICGGPVYVSDKVGRHNFDLLRKLVLPDGTILRCQHYALPTRDCLFENPLFDGKTLLKLWNLNKFGGVIGIFNCQGAGWYPEEHKCKAYPECYKKMSGFVSPNDVEWEQKDFTAQFRNNELFAVYSHKAGNLHLMKAPEKSDITLQPSSFEIFTISPVCESIENVKFAAIGLENLFNSGGAVEFMEQKLDGKNVGFVMKIKGAGKFLAYSSVEPMEVMLNNERIDFERTSDGVLKFDVPWIGGELSDACVLISV